MPDVAGCTGLTRTYDAAGPAERQASYYARSDFARKTETSSYRGGDWIHYSFPKLNSHPTATRKRDSHINHSCRQHGRVNGNFAIDGRGGKRQAQQQAEKLGFHDHQHTTWITGT
jgi:hypothetical protein